MPIIASTLRKHSTADWLASLDAADIPCGPINDIGQAFAEPQAKARGLAIATAHASGANAPGVRNPLRMKGLVAECAEAPPVLGQHTDAVLRDLLEKSEEEIALLRAAAVI